VKQGIPLNLEQRELIFQTADADALPVLRKVEAFEAALRKSDGRDLANMMWRRSQSTQDWLSQRQKFTWSYAASTMVGYVLGLGDRHPSNIMIDRKSGQVAHIDFGDCFEVARSRDLFPEMVPFRLTRMVINMMDVSGLSHRGPFFSTCVSTMQTLHGAKESLVAVLEAFVHDPLINWRLFAAPDNPRSPYGLGGRSLDSGAVGSKLMKVKRNDSEISRLEEETLNRPEMIYAGALSVIARVAEKLDGTDKLCIRSIKDDSLSSPDDDLGGGAGLGASNVVEQVERLVKEASSVAALSQAYVGWCSFW
jgi:FKBP12-rapamycin complex-associated protein